MSNLHWQNYNTYRLAKSKDVKVEDRQKLKTNYDPSQPYNMEYNGVKATFPPEDILHKHGLIEHEPEDHLWTGYNYEPIKMDLDQKKKHGWHHKIKDLIDRIHDSEILPSETLHQIYKDSPIHYDMADFGPMLHLASGSSVNLNGNIRRLLHDVMMYKLVEPITKHLHKEASSKHKELDEQLYDKLISGHSIGPVTFGSYNSSDENIGNFNPFILNDPHNGMNELLPKLHGEESRYQTIRNIIHKAPLYDAPKELHTRHLMNLIKEPEDLFHLPKNLILANYLSKYMNFPKSGLSIFRDLITDNEDNVHIAKAAQNLEEQLQKKQRLALTDNPSRYKLTIPKEKSIIDFLEGKYKHDPNRVYAWIKDKDAIDEDTSEKHARLKHPVKKLSDYVLEENNEVSSRLPRLHHLINMHGKINSSANALLTDYPLADEKYSPASMKAPYNPSLDVKHLNSSPLRAVIDNEIKIVKDHVPLKGLHVDLQKDELHKLRNFGSTLLKEYVSYKFYDALAKKIRGNNPDRQDIDETRNMQQYLNLLLPHFLPKSKEDYHDILEANTLRRLADSNFDSHTIKMIHPEIGQMIDILMKNLKKSKSPL